MTTSGPVPVGRLDAAGVGEATGLLRPCCASTRWADELLALRPHGTLQALTERSRLVIAGLAGSDLDEALAAHPRIGDRVGGSDRESSWSRQEQSATAHLSATLAQQLVAANLAYERRFGQVFLICATGKSTQQMLDALRQRLTNPPDAEREVVRGELSAIVDLRLAKTFR